MAECGGGQYKGWGGQASPSLYVNKGPDCAETCKR